MSRKIVVTSGKGGAGKTTVCVLLGKALAEMNKKVVVLDLDFALNNLDVVAGVEDKVVYDVADVVSGRCRVKQAIVEVERNLSVIQSDRSFSGDVTGQNVRLLAEGLDSRYDFILFDCPAGIEGGFARAVSAADEALVVVNPSLSSLRDADKVVNLIAKYKLDKTYVIVNKVRGDLVKKGRQISVADVEQVIKAPVIGAIPDDDAVLTMTGASLESGSARKAYRLLAKRLISGRGKVYDCESAFRSPFIRLKRLFGKGA